MSCFAVGLDSPTARFEFRDQTAPGQWRTSWIKSASDNATDENLFAATDVSQTILVALLAHLFPPQL